MFVRHTSIHLYALVALFYIFVDYGCSWVYRRGVKVCSFLFIFLVLAYTVVCFVFA